MCREDVPDQGFEDAVEVKGAGLLLFEELFDCHGDKGIVELVKIHLHEPEVTCGAEVDEGVHFVTVGKNVNVASARKWASRSSCSGVRRETNDVDSTTSQSSDKELLHSDSNPSEPRLKEKQLD